MLSIIWTLDGLKWQRALSTAVAAAKVNCQWKASECNGRSHHCLLSVVLDSLSFIQETWLDWLLGKIVFFIFHFLSFSKRASRVSPDWLEFDHPPFSTWNSKCVIEMIVTQQKIIIFGFSFFLCLVLELTQYWHFPHNRRVNSVRIRGRNTVRGLMKQDATCF